MEYIKSILYVLNGVYLGSKVNHLSYSINNSIKELINLSSHMCVLEDNVAIFVR